MAINAFVFTIEDIQVAASRDQNTNHKTPWIQSNTVRIQATLNHTRFIAVTCSHACGGGLNLLKVVGAQ